MTRERRDSIQYLAAEIRDRDAIIAKLREKIRRLAFACVVLFVGGTLQWVAYLLR